MPLTDPASTPSHRPEGHTLRHITIATLCAAAALLAPIAAQGQKLPAEIAASKTIRAALNTGYAPLEVRDTATIQPVGFDIDLAAAMAKVLGVKIEYQDGSFEQMTPSLQSGRVDMIMSGFYDIPRRRPFFDFIDYLRAGGQFYLLKSNTAIKVPTDLCGQTVTMGRSTSYVDTTKKWSDKNCVEAGKPPIDIITQTDFAQALSVIQQGRAAAGVSGMEAMPSTVERDNNAYRSLGEPISFTLMGIAFTKDDPTLRDAFAYALKQVIADGQYAALLKKWRLEQCSYTEVSINQGPAP
jgi:polar amino acid transport system substrate-binding protein